jgi:uncharacterized repeat protein (TIGR01451 family)
MAGLLIQAPWSGAADENPLTAPVPIPDYFPNQFSFAVELDYTAPGVVTGKSVKVFRGLHTPTAAQKHDNELKVLSDTGELYSATLADPSERRAEHYGFFFQTGPVFVSVPYDPKATFLVLNDLDPPRELVRIDLTQGIVDFCTVNKTDPTCTRDLRAGLTDTPDPVFAGNQLNYKATLANDGTNPAFNAELDIDLPSGLTVAAPPAGCTPQPDGDLTCTAAKLNPSSEKVFDLVIIVPSGFLNGNGTSTTVTATATASSAVGSDTDAGDDKATTTTLIKSEASLLLTKVCPAKVIPGSQYTCTITVSNSGPSDADKVVLSDDLPAKISLVGTPSGGGFSCTKAATNPELSCTHPPIKPGATHLLNVVFLLDDDLLPGAVLTNTAIVKSATPDPVPGDNQASRTGKVPECERTGSILNGTAADEVLCGTAGADNIHGQGGSDLIFTFGGNDNLDGGAGNDYLFGGSGDDELQGADGNDRLFGNLGNDHLQGAAGSDYGVGGPGTDSCTSIESGVC